MLLLIHRAKLLYLFSQHPIGQQESYCYHNCMTVNRSYHSHQTLIGAWHADKIDKAVLLLISIITFPASLLSKQHLRNYTNNVSATLQTNPLQGGYYNRINPLLEGVPPHIQRPPSGCHHILTGLKYSGASIQYRPYFPVVQFFGLQYSVLFQTAFPNFPNNIIATVLTKIPKCTNNIFATVQTTFS